MHNSMTRFLLLTLLAFLNLTGCVDERSRVSQNISIAAHNFEVNRRAVFYNGITGEYILVIEGLLSVEKNSAEDRLEVTVKVGAREYKKHYLGLSDNVTYFVEQIESVAADPFHYRVIFRPTTIVPDVEVRTR